MRWGDVRDALYPDTADVEDFSYERVLRLLRFIGGEQTLSTTTWRAGPRCCATTTCRGSARSTPG